MIELKRFKDSSSLASISPFKSFIPFWRIYSLCLFIFSLLYLLSYHQFVHFLILNMVAFMLRFLGVSIVLIDLSWLIARLIRKYSVRWLIWPSNRCVLVTGCDSGFGNELARRLDAYGLTVYAECLFPNKNLLKSWY